MQYTNQQPAHSYHTITHPDGTQSKRYSRYETGMICGKYRSIAVLIADETGFDGLGFDKNIGSVDDNWIVINLFDNEYNYKNSVAIAGAMDSNHAMHLAVKQFDYLGGTHGVIIDNSRENPQLSAFDRMAWSADTLQKLMDNPSQQCSYPLIITQKALLAEQQRLTTHEVMWDGINLVSHHGNTNQLLVDLKKNDSLHQLTKPFDLSKALSELTICEVGFDNLMDTYNRLDFMKERLFNALNRVKFDDLAVTYVTLTKPFKRQGVVNVAMKFDLSDGQSFTIWFHNPEATVKKLKSDDMMVSWKWLLNQRDVTAVVSPKNGENVQLPELALRMMKLAKANSRRFVNAQLRKAKNQQILVNAENSLTEKQQVLEQLNKDIADLQAEIEAFNQQKVIASKNLQTNTKQPFISDTKQNHEQIDVENQSSVALIDPIEKINPSSANQNKNFTELSDDVQKVSEPILMGRTNKVKTAKGTKLDTQFAVVEGTQLIVSHTLTGAENPNYPQELQPRDRGRKSSIAWVQKTANNLDPESLGRTGRADSGAPIVGDDLVVESGNGRTLAILLAYEKNQANEYRDWLMEEAEYFGFSKEKLLSFRQPILVRIRQTPVDRVSFTVEANQDDKLSYTATERAKSDAKRLNSHLFQLFAPSEDGDLLAVSNRNFIKGFLHSLGETEAAQYIDSNGNPTQALVARIKSAIFSKAYNDDRLLEMMADHSKPELQNMLNALSLSAPKFVEAQAVSKGDVQDIAEKIVDGIESTINDQVNNAIVDAVNMIMTAKRNNQNIAEFVRQQGLFEEVDETTAELAVFLATNARSVKKMSSLFKAMAEFIEKRAIDQNNYHLFGEPEPIQLKDVMDYANRVIQSEFGKSAKHSDLLSNAVTNIETPPDKTVYYSSEDIAYLQSIIKRTIDLELVDMDKIIAIGEKNDTDPLFEQALQVISDYEDELTKDI